VAGRVADQDGMTQKVDGSPVDGLFRWFTEVAIIAQLSGRLLEGMLPAGMTMSQFGVLNHLARVGDGQTPMRIARAMQVTKGAITNTLGHLERAGHVRITPDISDGRSKKVELTAEGRAARMAAIKAVSPELAAIASLVSPDDVATSLGALERVRRILDQRRA
jgi:DNA-binding MarR family transcriptional regulator